MRNEETAFPQSARAIRLFLPPYVTKMGVPLLEKCPWISESIPWMAKSIPWIFENTPCTSENIPWRRQQLPACICLYAEIDWTNVSALTLCHMVSCFLRFRRCAFRTTAGKPRHYCASWSLFRRFRCHSSKSRRGSEATIRPQRLSCFFGSLTMRNRNSMWWRTIQAGARRSSRPL